MATTAFQLGSFLLKCFPGGLTSTMTAALKTLDVATMGTQEASKFITTDSNTNMGIAKITALHIGTSGSETEVTSTPAELNILDDVTATAAELNYLDIGTLGTGAASKAVVLTSGDDYTWPATGILTYGVLKDPAATTLVATALELNEMCDMSAKVVAPATGDLTITAALHGNRVLYYNDADGNITLPAATGTGYTYTIIFKIDFTGGTIKCPSAADSFLGGCTGCDSDADGTAFAFLAAANDDTVTMNGVATGGIAGDYLIFRDVASGLFHVSGHLTFSGGSEVTPFSATVA